MSAPAAAQKAAAAFARGSCRPPSWNPSRMPATPASRSGTSGREFLELGHRSLRLLLCRLIPAGVVPDDTVQPGNEQPVGLRAQMILNHLTVMEHEFDKSKPAKPLGQRNKPVTGP